MNKRTLRIIDERFSAPNRRASSSGYGFDSQFNAPVNYVDSDEIMEPSNIASIYFNESEEEESDLLFDYEMYGDDNKKNDDSLMFAEDMIDISTVDRDPSDDALVDEMSENDLGEKELSPSELGLSSSMSPKDALKFDEGAGFGLVEALVLQSCE